MSVEFGQLREVIQRLRHPENGCPSDQTRDIPTTFIYIKQELAELDNVDEQEGVRGVEQELGDILFNVLFLEEQVGGNESIDAIVRKLIQFAEEKGAHPLRAARFVIRKMITRHPFLLSGGRVTLAESKIVWNRQKANEKISESTIANINFEKRGGSVPCYIQDSSGRVIQSTTINPKQWDSLIREKSFNGEVVENIFVDCDQDAVVIKVASHSGNSMFEKVKSMPKIGDIATVAIQNGDAGEIVMLAYANAEALANTFEQGVATLWSTSRNALWTKGKGSGNVVRVSDVRFSPETASFVYCSELPARGSCHTLNLDLAERQSCFYREIGNGSRFNFLEE